MRFPTRLVASLTLATALTFAPWQAGAQETTDPTTFGGEGDNVAVAINTKDGTSTFTVSFRIVRTSTQVVDNGNIAFAFASCEGCEALAIAVQVVLVSSDPSVVSPQNYAIAINFECTDCATLASAYQFVLGVDGNVHFTPEGNRVIAEIRRALYDLARSELTFDEIQAELDLLADHLRTVLSEELLTAGPPDVQVDTVEGTPASPSPSPSPSPVATDASPSSPTPDVSPSPTSAGTVSPSPTSSGTTTSPSPSVSPSPSPSATP